VNQLLGLDDLLFGVGHDQAMEILLLVTSMGRVGTTFTFLDRTFTTDGNLGTRVAFHLLQGIATRADK